LSARVLKLRKINSIS